MKISSEFSKYASCYDSLNVIQDKVADRLLSHISSKPKKILDLGCGSGALCKKIDWDYESFTGIDFASKMLELHPKSDKVKCLHGDFNDTKLFKNLLESKYDYILSSSALQWADNIETVFKNIKLFNAPIAFAIFTSNTFKTLNETVSLESFLKSADKIIRLQKKYFNANFEIVKYTMEFNSTREMLRYIKQSGVSGARNILNYKQTKYLLKNYPLNYLEFEVIFIY